MKSAELKKIVGTFTIPWKDIIENEYYNMFGVFVQDKVDKKDKSLNNENPKDTKDDTDEITFENLSFISLKCVPIICAACSYEIILPNR